MKRFRVARYLLCLALFGGALGSLWGGHIALASPGSSPSPTATFAAAPTDDQPSSPEPIIEKFELTSQFPVVRIESGSPAEFEILLNYQSSKARLFNFSITSPPGWDAAIKRSWATEKESLLAIRLEANQAYAQRVKVILTPLPGEPPELGDYKTTFLASSGDMSDSIELTAAVTSIAPTYAIDLTTVTGRLDTPVKAGQENPLTVKVTNTGTGTLKNITFVSTKSEGWGTKFSPSRITSLEPGNSTAVTIIITTPGNTISGDYHIIINSMTDKASDGINLRARVQTPTVWGGVGIAIVAAVVIGLIFLFRKLGRR